MTIHECNGLRVGAAHSAHKIYKKFPTFPQRFSPVAYRFKVVGIDKDDVSESFKEIGSFLVKSSEVIGVTDTSLKKYKALFQWLYHVIMSLIEEGYSLPGISEQVSQSMMNNKFYYSSLWII